MSPQIFEKIDKKNIQECVKNDINIKAVNGETLKISKAYKIEFQIENHTISHLFYITKDILTSAYQTILGFGFFKQTQAILDTPNSCLKLLNVEVPIIDLTSHSVYNINPNATRLKLRKKAILSPDSLNFLEVRLPMIPANNVDIVISPLKKLNKRGIDVLPIATTTKVGSSELKLIVRNLTNDAIELNKHMTLGIVNSFEEFPVTEIPISSNPLPPLSENDFELSALDKNLKQRLIEVLLKHKNAFARSTRELTGAKTQPHRIILEHENPIKCPIYKVPYQLRDEMRRQINDLLEAKIISPSNSQYNAPTLFVKQKNKWRLVLDFRRLNEITVTEDFVIPSLDDILCELSGKNYFSSVDLRSAFQQLLLDPRDRHKTAFSCPDGNKYHFNRLCFGLKNSPKSFQSMAQNILGDLLHKSALVYIDDVIIFSETVEEHLAILNEILNRFEKYNLKFSPNKCQFLTKSCKFLGFIISSDGISIDTDKTVKINDFSVPKNAKEVKSFLACCGFYRRYVKNFSTRAHALTNLLRKDVKFEWTPSVQAAFLDIKNAILNPPCLALPNFNYDMQITTDSSEKGIGAVLEQIYPSGEIKPLYFYSKKLNPTQSKYSATVLEFYAIYCALQFFRAFLIGKKKFFIYTDHKPLLGFLSNKNPSAKILRWKLALEEFNYEIRYVRGIMNPVADHLSRSINANYVSMPDAETIKKLQNEDPKLMIIINKLKHNSSNIDSYFLSEDGLLMHLAKRHAKSPRSSLIKQICVPHSLKPLILQSIHSEFGGHLRFFKTYHRLRDKFFWSKMYNDTKNFINSCETCLLRRSAFKETKPPHQPVSQSKFPGECCHVDIFGPLKPTTTGKKYVLSIIDAFTKYIHLVSLSDMKSETICKAIFDNFIAIKGSPEIMITDNATYFKSKEFIEFCKINSIEKRHISAYSAHVNGRVERPNSSIANILAAFCDENSEWDQLLPQVMMSLNSSTHEATHTSPFFLEHGRDMRLPYCIKESNPKFDSEIEYVQQLISSLNEVFSKTLVNLLKQESKHIRLSEKGNNVEKINYKLGSLCFVKTPNISSKLSPKLKPKYSGPFRVIERLSKVNYKLMLVNNSRKIIFTHVHRMIPFIKRFGYLHITQQENDSKDQEKFIKLHLDPKIKDESATYKNNKYNFRPRIFRNSSLNY